MFGCTAARLKSCLDIAADNAYFRKLTLGRIAGHEPRSLSAEPTTTVQRTAGGGYNIYERHDSDPRMGCRLVSPARARSRRPRLRGAPGKLQGGAGNEPRDRRDHPLARRGVTQSGFRRPVENGSEPSQVVKASARKPEKEKRSGACHSERSE